MADRFLAGFCNFQEMSEKEKRLKLGDLDIVMAGFAGLCGSVALVCEMHELLSDRYPSSFLEEAKRQERLLRQTPEVTLPENAGGACAFSTDGVTAMYLLSEGGVFAGLWEMGAIAKVGLEAHLKQIPILQETVEICNFFDVNPYQMRSDGSCLLLSENGGRLREKLREKGICSEVIGVTTRSNDKVVINGGERRYLQKEYPDALDQALMKYKEREKMKHERTIATNY